MTYTAVTCNEDGRVYKDFNSDQFTGSFEHWVEVKCHRRRRRKPRRCLGAEQYPRRLRRAFTRLRSGTTLAVRFYMSGSTLKLQLIEDLAAQPRSRRRRGW